MTDAEKAEEFAGLLSHWPSVLTICNSSECTLARHVREQYPDMITLEWGLNMPQPIGDLTVDERGVSGTLTIGGAPEFVFVPWTAVIDARVPSSLPKAPLRTAPPSLRMIKGGKA